MRKEINGDSQTRRIFYRGLLTAVSVICLALPATAEENGGPPIPKGRPKYFPSTYRSAMGAPLPFTFGNETLPVTIPAKGTAADPAGSLGFIAPGAVKTMGPGEHPFFKSLGTNGRSCGTCHQPSQAMSVTAKDIQSRFKRFGVKDPIFAPVDGANCPTLVPENETKPSRYFGGRRGRGMKSASAKARSLLLNDGLIRVFMPLTAPKPPSNPFTIKVVHDPYGCNSAGNPNSFVVDDNGNKIPIYSMYRRPLMSANLAYKTEFLTFGPPPPGAKSGNIMWDGREPTLESQAIGATFGHAQRDLATQGEMDPADVKAIVDYEVGFFTAQNVDRKAGALDKNGATGGVANLKTNITPASNVLPVLPPFDPNVPLPDPLFVPFNEFNSWISSSSMRASIARGQALFDGSAPNDRGRFTADDIAGFNPPGPPGSTAAPRTTCATCHNGMHGGGDMLQGNQRNIGTAGDFADHGSNPGHPLRKDLPIFEISCQSTPAFRVSATFRTNDPGLALHTGECDDVGRVTVPSLRGLSGRAPYFHDGSANTIADIVSFYNTRFNIGLTKQEKADLTNFLAAL